MAQHCPALWREESMGIKRHTRRNEAMAGYGRGSAADARLWRKLGPNNVGVHRASLGSNLKQAGVSIRNERETRGYEQDGPLECLG